MTTSPTLAVRLRMSRLPLQPADVVDGNVVRWGCIETLTLLVPSPPATRGLETLLLRRLVGARCPGSGMNLSGRSALFSRFEPIFVGVSPRPLPVVTERKDPWPVYPHDHEPHCYFQVTIRVPPG